MTERVLAFIPACNEVALIVDVIRRTRPFVDGVIVVDDGSVDGTGIAAKKAGATVLRHEHNRGKGAAIVTALGHFAGSNAEFAVLLDADGQHNPAEIPKFIEAALQSGAAIVVGNRMADPQGMPWVRWKTNSFTSWITSRLAGQRIPDSQCGFRLLRRSVLPCLNLSSSHFETETEMLIQAGRAGQKISSVPISSIYDSTRVSRIRPLQDGIRFFSLVVRYWRSAR